MSLVKKKKLVSKLDDLLFEDINDKLALIVPSHTNARNAWKTIIENLGGTWKENKKGWILPKQKVRKLKQYDRKSVDSVEEKSEKEQSKEEDSKEESETESESDSTDDELIQKVLTRRFKSQSEQEVLEEEIISDSENEDVLSLCRRIRHVYKEINNLKEELRQIVHKNE
jgi:hypothetical protein